MPAARSLLPPALAVLAVGAITVGAFAVAHRGSGGAPAGSSPPVLVLAGSDEAAAAPAANGVPPSASAPLPSTPGEAAVRTLTAGAADQGAVAALAKALGMDGAPARTDGGWTVVSDKHRLTVSDRPGRPWSYGLANDPGVKCHVIIAGKGPACPDDPNVPIPSVAPGVPEDRPGSTATSLPSPPDTGVATDTPTDLPSTAPNPGRPSDGKAMTAAAPVLAAVGLTGQGEVDRSLAVVRVTAAPTVDGLPTSGYDTSVTVDPHGLLVDASGWLGGATARTTYPLVTADEALAALPIPAIGCVDVCRPEVITGARLGLVLRYGADGDPLLVPAWLYRFADRDQELALVAVDPTYLGSPTVEPGGSGSGSGSSVSGGGQVSSTPGSGAPGNPGPGQVVPPGAPDPTVTK